jgi:hypothetical protein
MSLKSDDKCLEKVADNEPIFVLRAQDILAPRVVRYWARLADQSGVPREKVAEAHKLADWMLDWQEANGAQFPD